MILANNNDGVFDRCGGLDRIDRIIQIASALG
jgi:hypothetical protein